MTRRRRLGLVAGRWPWFGLLPKKTRGTGRHPIGAARTLGRFEPLEERSLLAGLSAFPPAVGFGAAATGGDGGPVVVADTAAEFRNYAQQSGPRTIYVQRMLDVGQVWVKSNITLVGDGNDGLIGELRLNNVQNVIIQNLFITNPDGDGDGDAIRLTGARRVWIDHVDVYDAPDGLIDITNASNNVTVSWSKFHYTANDPPDHNFAMLIGASDTSTGDRDKLKTTIHHNWWGDRVHERMPRARFGDVHVFNNYFNTPGNYYVIRAAIESELLVENNYFENVNDPHVVYVTTGTRGRIEASGNAYVNTSGRRDDGDNVFDPSYDYSLDNGWAVKSNVKSGAGVQTVANQAPTIGWLSIWPDPVGQGETVTVWANNVWDDEGVESVIFYRDVNNNGVVDFDTDEWLGTDWDGSAPSYWSWTGTADWGTGAYTILARARDNGLPAPQKKSAWASISGTVTNQAPVVDAGVDQTVAFPLRSAGLDGTVTDDGLPAPPGLTTAWSKVSGPGSVSFGDAAAVDTVAIFSAPGTYVLRLTADDGAKQRSDDVRITVETGSVAAGYIGESGAVTARVYGASDWHSVAFRQTYGSPVVVMGPPSHNGGDPAVMRVRNVTPTGFQFQIDEWDYLDGSHGVETIGYLVVEAGDHMLVDGTRIQAGTVSVDHNFTAVSFPSGFDSAPAVLAQTASYSGSAAVTERLQSVTTTGFHVRLQEEEGGDGTHAVETVGWIAIEAAAGESDELKFESAVTAQDVTQAEKTIPFSQSFAAAPVFLASVQTYAGTDPAALRHTALTGSGATVFVEEETSADSEVSHAAESVGYLAVEQGLIAPFQPAPEIKARYVFYNNSAFDGNDPSANENDEEAIAEDKEALRRMSAETADLQAGFANYTSYGLGINGLIVDIANPLAAPTADDFLFHVGNTDNPDNWLPAPDPASVTVTPGGGEEGSYRITIIWPDYAIRNTWLQVTVLAENLGLPTGDDVFYFGNAVGESGNSAGDAIVNEADATLARNHPRNFFNPATVTDPYDYNRDARVSATDVLIARANQTDSQTALKLLDVTAPEGRGAPTLVATSLGEAAASPGAWVKAEDAWGKAEHSAGGSVTGCSLRRAPATLVRDAVFAEAGRPPSAAEAISLAELTWVYDLQQSDPPNRPSQAAPGATVVDKLLAACLL